jgi:signal transduction histidine kinase/CheY-like chemotaxis protein
MAVMAQPRVTEPPLSFIERESLCLSTQRPGVPAQLGEDGFLQNLARHYPSAENNALERLVQLKRKLKTADTETFWTRLMEGMTDICHAQYGFVAKRVLADDHQSAVEMPPYGESGSCLLGVAFYYNDGDKQKAMHRDYSYLAWNSPCSYMKHEKVFLIPEHMSSFITNNPNALPFPPEGYIGIPLFADGKCFAHFGMMWTQDGLDQRRHTWSYTELLLHTLEDIIVDRLLNGQGFAKPRTRDPPKSRTANVIPRDAVTPGTQSLKPFAKSLSHELRTPMQGVVGMLDVMHATVQEQIEVSSDDIVLPVFQGLRESIETIQDSAKRAVEAADNVVHAYDMNMQVPDTPSNDNESPATASTGYFDYKPARVIEGSNIAVNVYKRRRSSPQVWHFGNATKLRHVDQSTRLDVSPKTRSTRFTAPLLSTPPTAGSDIPTIFTSSAEPTPGDFNTPDTKLSSVETESLPTPGLKHCRIRELIPSIIYDSLRVGGRPESAIGEPLELGERIVVHTRTSNGHISQKVIQWNVARDVPETLYADERDLTKLISAVFLNAVKFTEEGCITLRARLSKGRKFLVINCKDTGDGIPEDFQPELFKPFSREDDSLTRTKEGLGLGLLVAKGLARRLGGDINLVASEIEGPNKGSEFEIKIPFEPGEAPTSRSATPRSRTPEAMKASSQTPSSLAVPTASPDHSRPPRPSKILLPSISESGNRQRYTPALISPTRKVPIDRFLAQKYPLKFLVAEDNKINRKLLVNMLGKLGYKDVLEAFDGKEAVRIMQDLHPMADRGQITAGTNVARKVDVILMDLWMPEMDGYQATENILEMFDPREPNSDHIETRHSRTAPIVLAVSADVTDEAINRATRTGMEGFMTKPYKLADLQKLIIEFCVRDNA